MKGTIKFETRDDGGVRIWSPDILGLILAGPDPQKFFGPMWEPICALIEHNGMRADMVSIDRYDLIALKQLVSIVHDMQEAKETLPLLSRIDAALETN